MPAGGKRPGAGRPKKETGRKASVSLYLSVEVAEYLNALGTAKSEFIDKLVRNSREFISRDKLI